MAGSHEMSSTIGVPDSVHATGSLSGMFDDAATSTVEAAAAAAAAAAAEPALEASEQQSIDAANVGSTASASQPASSSPGPSARQFVRATARLAAASSSFCGVATGVALFLKFEGCLTIDREGRV